MPQTEHVTHLVGHHLADVILRSSQCAGIGQGFIGQQVFQALGILVSKLHRLHVAEAIGRHPREALRRLASHGVGGELLLVGHNVAHGTQQGAGAGLTTESKNTRHVSLPVFGLAGARVDEDVGVGEAGVVPGDPLHDVVAGVRSGDACGCLFGPDEVGAEGPVPIQNTVLHCLDIVGRGIGAVVEDHRLRDIESGHLRRGPTGALLQTRLSFEEARVTQI